MDLFNFSITQMELFMFIFFRVLALFMILPIFDSQLVYGTFKVLLSFVIALTLFPIVKAQAPLMPDSLNGITFYVIKEIFTGVTIGFVARLIFSGIELAAQFGGVQVGFGASTVMDPTSNQQMLVIAQFQLLFATTLFLTLDGHHLFFSALGDSLYKIPIGSAVLTGNLAKTMVDLTSTIFMIGIKLAAPITSVMIMTNAVLGILARFIPQINVLMMSFPLTIGVGLIIMTASIPFLAYAVKSLFLIMSTDMATIISLL